MTELAPIPTRPRGEQHARVPAAASSPGRRPGGLRLAQLAGIVGVLFAAFSVYWGLGGTWLVSTISGSLAEKSRAGQANLLVGAWIPAILKLAAAVVPLLAVRRLSGSRPTRSTRRRIIWILAWLEAGFLTLYGLVLTGVGLLIQADVIQPSAPDHRALAWHAYLWDPWFLVWGLLVLAALVRSRQKLVSRLEYGSGAVAMRYEPRR